MARTHSGTACCLSWTAEADGAKTKIELRGEFDLAALPIARSDLQEAVAEASGDVIVNVGQLAFIDSTGLRFLLEMKRVADARGAELLLQDISAPVRRVLEVTGISSFFQVEDPSADGEGRRSHLKAVG